MTLSEWFPVTAPISLGVIVGILAVTVAASLLFPAASEKTK